MFDFLNRMWYNWFKESSGIQMLRVAIRTFGVETQVFLRRRRHPERSKTKSNGSSGATLRMTRQTESNGSGDASLRMTAEQYL